MKTFFKNNLLYIVIIGFLLLTLGVGIYFLAPSTQNKSEAASATVNIKVQPYWANGQWLTAQYYYQTAYKTGTFTTSDGYTRTSTIGTISVSVSRVSGESFSENTTATNVNAPSSSYELHKVSIAPWKGGSSTVNVTVTASPSSGFSVFVPKYLSSSTDSDNYTFSDSLKIEANGHNGYTEASAGRSASVTQEYTFSCGFFDTGKKYYMYFNAIFVPRTYTVTYNANGGSFGSSSTQSSLVRFLSTYTFPTPTRPGYTFAGWKNGNTTASSTERLTSASNITWTAQWTQERYTINYNGNGGSTPSSQSVVYGQTINLPSTSWTGHVFTGWTYGGNTYSAGQSYSVPDYGSNGASVTFTANWRAERYDVIYVKGNGEGNSTGSVNYGNSLSLLAAPSRSGYVFSGWSCDRGGTYSAGQSYSPGGAYGDGADITFTAMWTSEVYNVYYNNGYGGSNENAGTISYSSGTYTLRSAPSRVGYTFIGWSCSADSSTYNASATYSIPDLSNGANIIFTAQWRINEHTVTYSAGGGSGSMAQSRGNYNSTINLSKNTFTRSGYVFLYWTDTNGNRYYDEQSYTFPDSDLTLTAQWQQVWTSQAVAPSGTGSESTPYLISSAGNLAWIASQSNTFNGVYFKVTQNIDLSSYKWLPIGSRTAFGGIFDGGGFIISGFETVSTTKTSQNGEQLYSNQGLFSQTNGATIQNLQIQNATIYGHNNVGVLVGSVSSSTVVTDCIIEDSIVNSTGSHGIIIGNNAGSVSNILVKTYEDASASKNTSLGGASQANCLYEVKNTSGGYSRYVTSSFDTSKWGIVGNEILPAGISWVADVSPVDNDDLVAWQEGRLG